MSITIYLKHSEEGEAGDVSRPYRQEKAPWDGYELYRLLSDGESHSIEVNSSSYHLQFQGDRIGAWSWLLVKDAKGEEIRLGHGWSTESCWNALTTIERGLWSEPVGRWKDPVNWNNPDAYE